MPARRASDRPIAIACLGFRTLLPERPDRNVPCFILCTSRATASPAFDEYFLPLFVFAAICTSRTVFELYSPVRRGFRPLWSTEQITEDAYGSRSAPRKLRTVYSARRAYLPSQSIREFFATASLGLRRLLLGLEAMISLYDSIAIRPANRRFLIICRRSELSAYSEWLRSSRPAGLKFGSPLSWMVRVAIQSPCCCSSFACWRNPALTASELSPPAV
jgi:hypothetical protein